jgi:aminopeptidase N
VKPYQQAFSNMPQLLEEFVEQDNIKLKKVVFEPTPQMASYLVAYCFGEFDVLETNVKSGPSFTSKSIPLRVICPKGLAHEVFLSFSKPF